MKIAVPLMENSGLESKVSFHFGRAPYFAIIEVSGGRISRMEIFENKMVEHSPGEIPRMLKEKGVELVVSCNMGMRAMDHFRSLGIEVMKGYCKDLKDALRSLGIDV